MKVLENKKLNNISITKQSIDDTSDLPYIPAEPLPAKSFAMLIVAPAGGGKTSFWTSLLLSHPTRKKPDINRAYYRYFDKIILFSPSKDTLPMDKLKLDESRIFLKYNDEDLLKFIDEEKEGENLNNLIVLDDSIRQIKNNKEVQKLVLNRRHLTHNPEEDNKAGLSVLITSQKFNAADTYLRNNMSDIIIFKTSVKNELEAIKNDLMSDLDKELQDELLKKAFEKKYGFLYIKNYMPTKDRYYINFNKVVFEDLDDDGDIDEIKVEENDKDLKNNKVK
jgi:GTPase SAR1 family protein